MSFTGITNVYQEDYVIFCTCYLPSLISRFVTKTLPSCRTLTNEYTYNPISLTSYRIKAFFSFNELPLRWVAIAVTSVAYSLRRKKYYRPYYSILAVVCKEEIF
jgi:hypothetical protein